MSGGSLEQGSQLDHQNHLKSVLISCGGGRFYSSGLGWDQEYAFLASPQVMLLLLLLLRGPHFENH